MSTKNVLLIFTVISLIFSVSCSGAGSIIGSGPSDSDVKSAIEKVITTTMINGMPMDTFYRTKEVKVNSVKILRRGDFNETGKYYPMQVKIDGSFVQEAIPGAPAIGVPPKKNCTFSGNGDFRLNKNDYGEWIAHAVPGESDKEAKLNCDN